MTTRKRQSRAKPRVSDARAARLYKLLRELDRGAKSRTQLLRKVRLGVRTFFRDLEVLRGWGIEILLQDRKYSLEAPLSQCLSQLPFPDPQLTFDDAFVLSKGSTPAHRKIRRIVRHLTR